MPSSDLQAPAVHVSTLVRLRIPSVAKHRNLPLSTCGRIFSLLRCLDVIPYPSSWDSVVRSWNSGYSFQCLACWSGEKLADHARYEEAKKKSEERQKRVDEGRKHYQAWLSLQSSRGQGPEK